VQSGLVCGKPHSVLLSVRRDAGVVSDECLPLACLARPSQLPQVDPHVAAVAVVGDQTSGDLQLQRQLRIVDPGEESLFAAARAEFAGLGRRQVERTGRHQVVAERNRFKVQLDQTTRGDAFLQKLAQLLDRERRTGLPRISAFGDIPLRSRGD